MEYVVQSPELAAALAHVDVRAAEPKALGKALSKALKRVAGYEGIEFVTARHTGYLTRRKVLDADGAVLHDDYAVWISQEFANHGADARRTFERHRGRNLRLSQCDVSRLYFVLDRGGDQDNFVQIEVELHIEREATRLFQHAWYPPTSLESLMDEATADPIPESERSPIGPPTLHLGRIIDMRAFMQVVDACERVHQEHARARTFNVLDPKTGERIGTRSIADLDPGFGKFPAKARRLFQDWAASSAGHSGQRICRHWMMTISDYTDPTTGFRHIGLVPLWASDKKLAEVKARSGDDQTFFARLRSIDQRTGAPFGWYFYMLHGNRVREDAGHRVLRAAERGLIELAERDYQVLRRWAERTYGF